MNASLRAQIKKRDKYRCRYCGGTDRLTIDHIIPTSRGGHPLKKANLVTACFTCNQLKANKTPEEAGLTIIEEGYSYTPPGRLSDDLESMTDRAIINHGRKRKRKAKRRDRKQLVKAIMRDGPEGYICPCGVGFHTIHYHEHHMTRELL